MKAVRQRFSALQNFSTPAPTPARSPNKKRPRTEFEGVGSWLSQPTRLDRLLDEPHVFGARAFGALADVVVQFLTFPQIVEIPIDERAVVEEDIVAVTLDESKTTIGHQPLNLTLWHCCLPK